VGLWKLPKRTMMIGKSSRRGLVYRLTHRWQLLEAVLTLLCALSDDIRSILDEDDEANIPHTVRIQELYSDVVAGLMFEYGQPSHWTRRSMLTFRRRVYSRKGVCVCWYFCS
jgi:hypothetical protein